MANQFINAMTALWNSAGTTYSAIKMNVTNAASAAGSMLLELQVGSINKFSVDKNGNVIAAGSILGTAGVTSNGPALPNGNDTAALGAVGNAWSDLFLASGGVINWDAGDVTITHVANTLRFAGATAVGGGYTFDALVAPAANDGAPLGSTSFMWSDLFLASGSVINWNNGDLTLTHGSNLLTLAGGSLSITTPGTATGSVVTVGGTQTLTAKTLTSPVINTPTINTPTIATPAITGGTITGSTITGSTITDATINTPIIPQLVGVVVDYAGAAAPAGWLLCYGQAVSRATYSALFAVLSTTYGVGDGATTFNLPDLRGRVIAGQDDMGGTSANRLTGTSGSVNGDTLGGAGGAETHQLTEAQLASHIHGAGSYVTDTEGNHNHDVPCVTAAAGVSTGLLRGTANSGLGTLNPLEVAGTHSHDITGSSASIGSDTAHNNVQPTIILNKIICTGLTT